MAFMVTTKRWNETKACHFHRGKFLVEDFSLNKGKPFTSMWSKIGMLHAIHLLYLVTRPLNIVPGYVCKCTYLNQEWSEGNCRRNFNALIKFWQLWQLFTFFLLICSCSAHLYWMLEAMVLLFWFCDRPNWKTCTHNVKLYTFWVWNGDHKYVKHFISNWFKNILLFMTYL